MGEEFVFLNLTEKPRKSVPYINMPMFKKGYLRTSWILGAEAVINPVGITTEENQRPRVLDKDLRHITR